MSTVSESGLSSRDLEGRRRIPGEEGVWVFILGDLVVFAVFFLTYLYYRGQDKTTFIAAQGALKQSYGVINTLLLLTSSLFVVVAVRAVRQKRPRIASAMFLCAMLCGFGFVVSKCLEYSEKINAGITPSTNSFFMYYFVLTGLHLFHLLMGLAVLAFLFLISKRPRLSARHFALLEGGACFWHMVDLLWIVLFPLLYLIR
jgi:nitric oxide reductase NorE protein